MEKLIIGLNPTTSIEISSDDPKELVQKASFWSALPSECPVCGRDLVFTYRTPQDYKYYGLRCSGSPSHSTTFGEYKKGGGLYYKASAEWTVYSPGQVEDDHSPAPNNRLPKDSELLEPTAELNRLADLIAKEWHSKPRSQSYDSIIRERYGVSPDKLTIAQRREILGKLQSQNSTAGANNGR